jgi:hypothetical protein
MIDGSNQFYIDELVLRSEESGGTAEEWGSALKAVTTAIKDVTAATVSLVTQVELSGASSDEAVTLLSNQKLISLSLMVGEAVINTSIDLGVAISKADAASGVSVVLSGLSAAVDGLVYKFTNDKALSGFIAAGMKGGSRLPHMIAAFTGDASPEEKAGKFLDQLGGLVGDAFTVASIATYDKDDPDNTKNQKELAAVKAGATTAMAGVSAALKGKIISKLKKGDWNGVAQVCVSVAGTVVKGAFSGVAAQEALDQKDAIGKDSDGAIKQATLDKYGIADTDSNFEDLYDAEKLKAKGLVDAGFAKAATRIDDSVGGLGENINGLLEQGKDGSDPIGDKIKLREEEALRAKELASRTADEEAAAALREEDEEFGETLRLMGKDQLTDTDLKSIGKLIAKMQRDRMIIQTASSVGGAGFAIASQFFAPMAIAGTLIKFLEMLTAAVNRAIELRNWVDASTMAFNAVSPYFTAIENFVKNQAEQFSHFTIKAALIAVQAAAQIVQVVGVGTYAQAVGLIVEKGAKLAETIEDLAYKFYKEATLRAAWKVTKPALKNPSNRKANLIARRINPTLAKYTLAFGAVIDKDPVALEAFRVIGLDAETLASRDAKVDSVKRYLETRYDEDIQVYKAFTVETEDSWILKAPAPSLTTDCFLTLHIMAVSKGGVEDTRPNAITRAFRDVEQLQARYAASTKAIDQLDAITDLALDPHLDVFADYEAALVAVSGLLQGFAPNKKGSDETEPDLQSALQQLAELAETEISIVELERSDIFGRSAQLPPNMPPEADDIVDLLGQVGREMLGDSQVEEDQLDDEEQRRVGVV